MVGTNFQIGEVLYLYWPCFITKNNNILKLAIDYEVVVPMAYNISALLTFSDRAEMPLKKP